VKHTFKTQRYRSAFSHLGVSCVPFLVGVSIVMLVKLLNVPDDLVMQYSSYLAPPFVLFALGLPIWWHLRRDLLEIEGSVLRYKGRTCIIDSSSVEFGEFHYSVMLRSGHRTYRCPAVNIRFDDGSTLVFFVPSSQTSLAESSRRFERADVSVAYDDFSRFVEATGADVQVVPVLDARVS